MLAPTWRFASGRRNGIRSGRAIEVVAEEGIKEGADESEGRLFYTIASIRVIAETPGRLIMFDANRYQEFIECIKGGIPVVKDLLIDAGLISRYQDIGAAGLNSAMERAWRAKPSQIGLAPAYYAYRAQCSAVTQLSDDLFVGTENVFEILGELLIKYGYWQDADDFFSGMFKAFPDYASLVGQYSDKIESRHIGIGRKRGYI